MDGSHKTSAGSTWTRAAGLLDQLRFFVRSYVVVEGLAVVVAVLGAAFWISLALDRGLELAVGWRIALLAGTLVAASGLLLALVARRLFGDFHPRALALVLERRYPQLDDRLITTVESAASPGRPVPALTESMLKRTAEELGGLLPDLKLGEVFNLWPLVRALSLAVALLISVGAFTALAGETASLWFRRNVLLKEEFWPRQTDLMVRVLADPGERVVEFRQELYKHPQGQNLTLVAEVPEGKVIPDQVQLVYRLEGGGGATETLARIGDRSFRFTVSGLQSTARLWFYGGDYASRTPLRVEVVAPPRIDRLRMESQYPAYTGKSPEVLPVSGTQISLPAATEFVLRGATNKPLQALRLESEAFSLEIRKDQAVLRQPPDGPEVPLTLPEPMLSSQGTQFAIPCALATCPVAELLTRRGPAIPLRLPPAAVLTLHLHDVDDILSAEPTRLTVNSTPDEAPSIKTELRGIGNAVTRQATIPLAGTIHDDYGIVHPRFDFRLDGETQWEPRSFLNAVARGQDATFSERFEVLPLDLKIGQKLTLAISSGDAFAPLALFSADSLSIAALPLSLFAQDIDELTGPHRVQGDRYTFEIVTNEELLAQIAARELNLRQRFEQIIAEVEETRRDLQLQRSHIDEWLAAGDESAVTKGWDELSIVTERSVSRNAKNRNETISVEESFADVSLELKNNSIPNIKEVLARIDEGVVQPLHAVNTVDYVAVDDELTRLKQALEIRSSQTPQDLDACVERLNILDAHLKDVLAQMLKIESYNEALQLLRDIIQTQEEVRKKTEAERKRKAIKDLQEE